MTTINIGSDFKVTFTIENGVVNATLEAITPGATIGAFYLDFPDTFIPDSFAVIDGDGDDTTGIKETTASFGLGGITKVEGDPSTNIDGGFGVFNFGISFHPNTRSVNLSFQLPPEYTAEDFRLALERVGVRGSEGNQKAASLVPPPVADIVVKSNSWLSGYQTLLQDGLDDPDIFVVTKEHVLELVAENTGDITLNNVQVSFADPSRRLDLVQVLSGQGAVLDQVADTVLWTIPELAPGQVLKLHFTGFLDLDFNFPINFEYEGNFGTNEVEVGDTQTDFSRFSGANFKGSSYYTEVVTVIPDDGDSDNIPEAINYQGAATRLTGNSDIPSYEAFGSLPFTIGVTAESSVATVAGITDSFTDKNLVASGVLEIFKPGGGLFFFDNVLEVKEGSRVSTSSGITYGSDPTPAEFITIKPQGQNVYDASGPNQVTLKSAVAGDEDAVTGGTTTINTDATLFYSGSNWVAPFVGVSQPALRDALASIAQLSPSTEITLDTTDAPQIISNVPQQFGAPNNISKILIDENTTFELGNQNQQVDLSTVDLTDPTGGVPTLTFQFNNSSFERFEAPNELNAHRNGIKFNIRMENGADELVIFHKGDQTDDVVSFGRGNSAQVVRYIGLNYTPGIVTGTTTNLIVSEANIGRDTITGANSIEFANGIYNTSTMTFTSF